MATAQRFLPSSNPYGGGTVLDSSPYTQYFLNKQAREQAKEEALDNYFQDIDSKINPAGMRTQEIPILIQQQNDDRKFYLKNKDFIKNPAKDNGAAYNEYMQRNQQKKAFIENSKRKGDLYKQAVPIFADPNKRALMGDEAIEALRLHDLPLNDPNHREFDVTKINYNPKPFDETKFRTGLNPYIKEVAGETEFVTLPDADPKNPQYLRKPVTKMLQNFDKMQIAQVAENEYQSNPSFRKLVSQIEGNQTQYEKYNKIYKQAFGRDLDIQHPEQIAVAHTLSLMPQGYTKEGKPELDQVAWEKAKDARNFGQSKTLIGLNRAAQENYIPQSHVQAIWDDGSTNIEHITIGKEPVKGRKVVLPDEIKDKFMRTEGTRKRVPDYFYMTEDRKDIYPVFVKGKTGTGNDIIDVRPGERISVETGLIPQLSKTFGGQAFTKKTIYTNPPKQQSTGKQKIAGF